MEKKHFSIEGCEIDWLIDEGKGLRVHATAPDYTKGMVVFVFFYGCYQNLVDADFTVTVYVDEVYMTVTREDGEEKMSGVNLDGSEVTGYADWFEESVYNAEDDAEDFLMQMINIDRFHKQLSPLGREISSDDN